MSVGPQDFQHGWLIELQPRVKQRTRAQGTPKDMHLRSLCLNLSNTLERNGDNILELLISRANLTKYLQYSDKFWRPLNT
eukprot:3317270-Amphidinium_carterae.2